MKNRRNIRGWEFNDAAIIGNKMYFVAGRRLYFTDVNSYKTYYVDELKDNEWLRENWVAYVEAIDQVLFLIARDNKRIYRYDTSSGEHKQIYEKTGESTSIHVIAKKNKKLMLFCKDSEQIVVVHEDGTVKMCSYHCDFFTSEKGLTGVLNGDYFYLFSNHGRDYGIFDLNDMVWQNYKLPIEVNDCRAIGIYSNIICILDGDDISIIEDNSEKNRITMKTFGMEPNKYGLLFVFENKLLLLPKTGDDIYEISYDGDITKYDNYPEDFEYTKDDKWLKTGNKYYQSAINDGIVYFARRATNYMLTIEINTGNIVWIPIERTGLAEYIRYFNLQGKILEENKFDLNDLVDLVKGE